MTDTNKKYYSTFKLVCIIFAGTLITSCGASKKLEVTQSKITEQLASPFFDNHYTGFMVYNPRTKQALFQKNAQKYFTPASNTKIFTLYASLQLIPKISPLLKYIKKNNETYIEGVGNPTIFHPDFKDNTALDFLKSQDRIVLALDNFKSDKYGAGWAWEDYEFYFSPERSSFPLYGNILRTAKTNRLYASPNYFKQNISLQKSNINREMDRNQFYLNPNRKDTIDIPFKINNTIVEKLLEETIGKNVSIAAKMPKGEKEILYGIKTDSIYKKMMQKSDNFLAEQLLIMASSTFSEELDPNETIQYVLNTYLPDLKHKPKWVDGSGLSRYNLFTPHSFVQVLEKMYQHTPKERLFSIFPAGGRSGTLKNWYKGNPEPYIYAKSGTLGNNYCLSGYLITKSGKTLIFSFMNNHFTKSTASVKREMQTIFELIRDKY